MPTVAARSFLKSPAWLPVPARNCPTCIFPSQAWRIFSCTIPEGACAIELENFFRHAGTRRACGAQERDATSVSNFPAAAVVRLHLRTRHGRQRLHAGNV